MKLMGRSSVGALLIAMLGVATARANPQYDHVVVVVMENHGYSQIVGSSDAPYINSTLLSASANITNAYGIEHPSQPNYYWLFSGSNQGITDDQAPTAPTLTAPNLYSSLTSAGLSFAGYAGSFL